MEEIEHIEAWGERLRDDGIVQDVVVLSDLAWRMDVEGRDEGTWLSG